MPPLSLTFRHPLATVRLVSDEELAARARRVMAAKIPPPPDPAIRLAGLLESLHVALEELEQRRRQSLEELQQAAVELAILAASHVLGRAVEEGEFPIFERVRQSIVELGIDGPCRISLHPEDLALARSQAGLAQAELEWIADPHLARGSCRAERPGGDGVLSALELQLSDIRRHWLENLDAAQIERRRPETDAQSLRRFPDRRETA